MTSRHTERRACYKSEPRIHGYEMSPQQIALIYSRLQYDPQTGCLNWTGSLSEKGYPQVVWRGKKYRVHILLNERAEGTPVPPGLEVDHECNNRACCNPQHTERVTHAENIRRIQARDALPLFDWRSARDHAAALAHIAAIWQE